MELRTVKIEWIPGLLALQKLLGGSKITAKERALLGAGSIGGRSFFKDVLDPLGAGSVGGQPRGMKKKMKHSGPKKSSLYGAFLA